MRKRLNLFAILFLFSITGFSQSDFVDDVLTFQNDLNKHYSDSVTSPLTIDDRKVFTGLDFFPPDKYFRIEAALIKKFNPLIVTLKTTTDRAPRYILYAEAMFVIEGKKFHLNVYKSELTKEGEKEYAFIPFTDLSNGVTTYTGGRYIEVDITGIDSIIIDFNKAYNPYCAYNHKYSCVVPPSENFIDFEINAGVKKGILKK